MLVFVLAEHHNDIQSVGVVYAITALNLLYTYASTSTWLCTPILLLIKAPKQGRRERQNDTLG